MVAIHVHRNRSRALSPPMLSLERQEGGFAPHSLSSGFLPRPNCWIAVRSRSLPAVQSALGLHNPKPCSWMDGLAGEQKLFIAPPVKGWILVMGSGLPEPSEDVDACFRF